MVPASARWQSTGIYTADIKAFTRELSAIGRNINQIAKRINAGGPSYQADMDEIWQLQGHILSSGR